MVKESFSNVNHIEIPLEVVLFFQYALKTCDPIRCWRGRLQLDPANQQLLFVDNHCTQWFQLAVEVL